MRVQDWSWWKEAEPPFPPKKTHKDGAHDCVALRRTQKTEQNLMELWPKPPCLNSTESTQHLPVLYFWWASILKLLVSCESLRHFLCQSPHKFHDRTSFHRPDGLVMLNDRVFGDPLSLCDRVSWGCTVWTVQWSDDFQNHVMWTSRLYGRLSSWFTLEDKILRAKVSIFLYYYTNVVRIKIHLTRARHLVSAPVLPVWVYFDLTVLRLWIPDLAPHSVFIWHQQYQPRQPRKASLGYSQHAAPAGLHFSLRLILYDPSGSKTV